MSIKIILKNSTSGLCVGLFSDDVNFKTQLDKECLDLAKRELHEEEKDRITAVQSFRNLVCQEKWLRTPTGLTYFSSI